MSEHLNLEKEWPFFWVGGGGGGGSYITVPLHLTSVVNNLIRYKVCFVKCVIKMCDKIKSFIVMCFSCFINMQIKKICICV